MSGWAEGLPTEEGCYWVSNKAAGVSLVYKGHTGFWGFGCGKPLDLHGVSHHMPAKHPGPPLSPEMVPRPEVSLESLDKRLAGLEHAFYHQIMKGHP